MLFFFIYDLISFLLQQRCLLGTRFACGLITGVTASGGDGGYGIKVPDREPRAVSTGLGFYQM
jgi:hypothetical protein